MSLEMNRVKVDEQTLSKGVGMGSREQLAGLDLAIIIGTADSVTAEKLAQRGASEGVRADGYGPSCCSGFNISSDSNYLQLWTWKSEKMAHSSGVTAGEPELLGFRRC